MKVPYPRNRMRDSLKESFMFGTFFDNCLDPMVTFPLAYPGVRVGERETIFDYVVPRFASRSVAGEIHNNPMVQKKTKFFYEHAIVNDYQVWPTDRDGCYTRTFSGPYGALMDNLYYETSLRANMPDSLINEEPLMFKAAVEARTRISPILVQSLVSLAELPKTLDLIRETAKSLFFIIRGCKNGNLADIKRGIGGTRSVKSFAGFARATAERRWLEYRYGWTPLVMEVQGAIKALSKKPPFKQRATSRRSISKTVINPYTKILVFDQFGDHEYSFVVSHSVDARAYCLFTADLEHQSHRDFGVTELPLAVWELVPFSFVIDWFIPVGNWIEALTPKLGINILAEGVTVTNRRVLTRTLKNVAYPIPSGLGYTRSGVVGLTDVYEEFTKRRVPSLTGTLHKLPGLDVKLNVKRVIDSIALLGQLSNSRSLRI